MKIINVTEDHIRQGFRDHCGLCPIALALMETDPDIVEVNVSYGSATLFYREKKKEDWSLPVEAIEFYRTFDRGLPVEPFSFNLHHYE